MGVCKSGQVWSKVLLDGKRLVKIPLGVGGIGENSFRSVQDCSSILLLKKVWAILPIPEEMCPKGEWSEFPQEQAGLVKPPLPAEGTAQRFFWSQKIASGMDTIPSGADGIVQEWEDKNTHTCRSVVPGLLVTFFSFSSLARPISLSCFTSVISFCCCFSWSYPVHSLLQSSCFPPTLFSRTLVPFLCTCFLIYFFLGVFLANFIWERVHPEHRQINLDVLKLNAFTNFNLHFNSAFWVNWLLDPSSSALHSSWWSHWTAIMMVKRTQPRGSGNIGTWLSPSQLFL